MNPQDAQQRSWSFVLVPPLAVAIGLRLLGLDRQILVDDELHAVHAALTLPIDEIVATWQFGHADYGVPMAALYRGLMDAGVGFSEWTFRIPSLLAGLLAVIVLPPLASARIGRRAAIALAWLIAVSPMLVFYSRIVRPYMMTAFLVACAVLLLDRFRQRGQRWAALGTFFAAALAIYHHLAAAPAVAGMFFFQALLPARENARPQPRHVIMLGLATALGASLLLLPGMASLRDVIAHTRDGTPPGATTWLAVTQLQLGTASAWLAIAAALVALRGAAVLVRHQGSFGLYLVAVVACQVVGLLVLAPDRFDERMVLNRYLLVVLPLLLLSIGVGATAPWWPGQGARARRIETGVAVAALALLVVAGPLGRASYRESSFSHMLTSLDFTGDGNRMPLAATPPFYTGLAAFDGRPIIEYPWQNMSAHAFDAYQRVHGQPVYVASVIDRSDEPRLALRNRVEPLPEAMLASPAHYVVVHLDLESEARQMSSSDPSFEQWLRAREKLWLPLHRAGRAMERRLRQAFGPPAYADPKIVVWDLERARRQGNPER